MAKTTTAVGMSKMDAVRRALKDLGNHAMPKQLQPHIKERYGIDMSVDHVSTYKSQILRKKARGKGRKAAPKESPNGAALPAVRVAAKPAASSLSQQVAMLKDLAHSIGKEEAKRIIDLF